MSHSKFNVFNKQQIAKTFNKIAANYDQAAMLPQEIAHRLVERLDYIKLQPHLIVELGAGTGFCAQLIQQRYPNAKIIAIDISHNMLRYTNEKSIANTHTICADAYHLPLKDNSVDLIISNMMLPWCEELVSLFRECHRVLSPDKLLLFATVGPDTLNELRISWSAIDHFPHVNSFVDMHDIGDALLHAELLDPVMDVEHIQLMYPHIKLLLKDLKMLGSRNLHPNKRRSLLSKMSFTQLQAEYKKYQLESNEYPATCEIVYGHAWSTESSETFSANDKQIISIPLAHLRKLSR